MSNLSLYDNLYVTHAYFITDEISQ